MNIINIIKNTSWVRFKRFLGRLFNRNERLMYRHMRLLQAQMQKARQADQATCPHLAGSNAIGVTSSNLTSIVWHFYNDKVWRGICTNCHRLFVPADKDYGQWINRRSFNLASKAGESVPVAISFWHGKEARAFSGLDEEAGQVRRWKANDDSQDMNDWSDEQVKAAMDEVRRIRKLGVL